MTAERGTPARLAIDHPDPVQVARRLLATRLALRRDFAAVIGDGSGLLLAAFILQAEGACVTAVALEALLGGPRRIVRRWLAALASEGLVRPIDDSNVADAEPVRLAPETHGRLERALLRASAEPLPLSPET